MDFINQAKQLADAVKNKAEKVANDTANSVNGVVNTVTESVNEIQKFSTTSVQSGLAVIQNVSQSLSDAATNAVGVTASGMAIANALKDLPRTAEELAREMPKIASRLRNGAGLRVGDAPRSDADVMGLFNKIPGTSKLGASETNIRQFLADKHGSHIIPRSAGGSNGAENVLWEVGTDNLRRGAQIMTGGEQIYIRVYNAVDSIVRNSATIAKLGIAATATAILTQAIVSAISYSLDLYRGEITVQQYKDLIIQEAATAGIAAPIFFLILIAVLALFPELTPILSAPIVVAGFNALFGISIAVPIIKSIVRHVKAGGFGEEVSDGYKNLITGSL